jgi:hypothetical protein
MILALDTEASAPDHHKVLFHLYASTHRKTTLESSTRATMHSGGNEQATNDITKRR